MKKRHCWRRGAALAAALWMIGAAFPAGALPGYSGGKLSIVSEPGEDSSYLHYHRNGEELTSADMNWVEDGHTGKAISLDGAGETLELEYNQLQMHTMTFAGWYCWEGSPGEAEERYSQRLFTLSHSDDLWLTVMPHARDAETGDEEGRVLDGVFMEFYQGTGGDVTDIKSYNPAEPGEESYGLPMKEWHHVALTMDGQTLRLYIDGRLWFEEMLILGVEEMRNNMLTIGGGRWEGEPTFYGKIDDMAIYDFAMSAEQIALLNAGVDPLAEGAELPATTAPSLPAEPTAATTQTTAPSQTEDNGTLFGLPVWTVVLLAVFLGLSVLLSIYQPPAPPGKPPAKRQETKALDGKGGGKGGDRP